MSNENSYHTAIKKGIISEMFKDAFARYGRPELFNPEIDYEKGIFGVASKIFNKAPMEIPFSDKDDLVIDALMNTLSKKEIKTFDPKKIKGADPIKWFAGRVFSGDLLNQMDKYIRIHNVERQQRDTDEFTQEEVIENIQDKGVPKDPGNLISNDMNRDIYKFIEKRSPKNSPLGDIFYLLTEKKQQKEIAKLLGISKGQVSKELKKIQGLVIAYAKDQKDDKLSEMIHNRLSMDITSEEGVTSSLSDSDFFKLFQDIEKKYSIKAKKRTPSGKTLTLQKTRIKDSFNDSYIGEMILNSSITSKDIEEELERFVGEIESMDDLIEDGDSIIALRIVDTSTRQISSFENE